MEYDVVLMVTPDKIPLLKTSYEYLIHNLGANIIFLVGSTKCKEEIEKNFYKENRIVFLDEDQVFPGLNYKVIKNLLELICGDSHRTGWFFQQFLKMAFAYRSEHEYYLVFDSDTVPLNPIAYFDHLDKPSFITKKEYYQDYFNTIDTLFNGRVKRVDKNISYISENMIISKSIMIGMIEEIMKNDLLIGESFYEKIMYAIDKRVIMNTGFSEYETYGNYVMTVYPENYRNIKLRTQRLGSFLFGTIPTKAQLEWAAKDYDIISFEEHGKQWLIKKTKSEKIRSRYTAKELFDKYIKISNFLDLLRGRSVVRIDD